MDNFNSILLAFILGGISSLLIVIIIKYLVAFSAKIAYAKRKMRHAYSWPDYVRWRREVQTLRWCIIPGLTPDRVKNIKAKLFKGDKKEKSRDGLIPMLIPSVASICLCAICLVGGSFAWFTASQNISAPPIISAEYSVDISLEYMSIIENAGNHTNKLKANADGTYTLTAGNKYTVYLTANGTASTGYCIISFNETSIRHTVQFPTKENADSKQLSFFLEMNEDAIIQIQPQWGTSAWDAADKFENGQTYIFPYIKNEENTPQEIKPDNSDPSASPIPDKTPSVPVQPDTEDGNGNEDSENDQAQSDTPITYTVQRGDSLSEIAQNHGISTQALIAYNNISNPSLIYSGQVIKIPPADLAE